VVRRVNATCSAAAEQVAFTRLTTSERKLNTLIGERSATDQRRAATDKGDSKIWIDLHSR